MAGTKYKICMKCGKARHKDEMILRNGHQWCAFCVEEENAEKSIDELAGVNPKRRGRSDLLSQEPKGVRLTMQNISPVRAQPSARLHRWT